MYIIGLFVYIIIVVIVVLIVSESNKKQKAKSLKKYLKAKAENSEKREVYELSNKKQKGGSLGEYKKTNTENSEEIEVYELSNNKYNEPDYSYFTRTIMGEDNASNIGRQGEYMVFKEIKKANVFNIVYANVYIPIEDNKTTEVDLIMIAEYGIFIIEVKNYKGWIFGKDNDKQWTVMYNKKRKHQFANPVSQNDLHLIYVSIHLRLPTKYFKSYIVFGDNCDFKDVTVNKNNVKVMKSSTVEYNIMEDLKTSEKIFSKEKVEEIASEIEEYTRVSEKVKNEHIENIVNNNKRVSKRKGRIGFR